MCVVSKGSLLMRAKDKEFGQNAGILLSFEVLMRSSGCLGDWDWSHGSEMIWAERARWPTPGPCSGCQFCFPHIHV